MATPSRQAVCQFAKELAFELRRPPNNTYRVTSQYLRFPFFQDEVLSEATDDWLVVLERDLPDDPTGKLFAALQSWLEQRKQAIVWKISQEMALYSDALMLGIVR